MPTPTQAQAEAGNYKMRKIRLHGMAISIETLKGQRRNPAWPPMPCHYGYVRGTMGRDGDHVDVMIGPNPKSELVVVVDQVNVNGTFDEHKCLIGFDSTKQAVNVYRKCYTKGWKVGPVTTMTIGQFKRWLTDGSQMKRIEKQVSRYSAEFEEAHPRGKGGVFIPKLSKTFFDRFDGKNFRDKAVKWAQKHFKNKVVTNKTTGMPVRFDNTSFDKTATHLPDDLPLLCLQKLESLIENATYEKYEKPRRGSVSSEKKRRQQFAGYHTLKSAVNIDRTLHDVLIKVRIDKRGHTYYDNHVIKKSEPPYKPSEVRIRDATTAGDSPKLIIGPNTMKVNKYSADSSGSDRWITVRPHAGGTGHPVMIDRKGIIKAGMGGKFNGKNVRKIGESEKKPKTDKKPKAKSKPTSSPRIKKSATPSPGSEPAKLPQAPRNFAEAIAATIREHEVNLPKQEAEEAKQKAEAESHPLHWRNLPNDLRSDVLHWTNDAHEIIQPISQRAQGAQSAGIDPASGKADEFSKEAPRIQDHLRILEAIESKAKLAGINLASVIKHSKLMPREIAARLPGGERFFHDIEDHERFSAELTEAFVEYFAARPRNSPGQVSLLTGEVLRSSKRQTRLWGDNSKPAKRSASTTRTSKGSASGSKPVWRTINGAKVLIQDGVVIAGANGKLNGKKVKPKGSTSSPYKNGSTQKFEKDGLPSMSSKKSKPKSGITESKVGNDTAKSGDQLGLIEGEGKHKPSTKLGNTTTGTGKTGSMFGDLKSDPDQMDMFGGDGTPDDLVYEPDDTKSKDSPREEAVKEAEAKNDYDFARNSSISNAGEDLKGSARHIRNAWRSLAEAEEDGSAEMQVTRANLMKNEPHSLSDSVDDNPIGALTMHLALKAFPAKPKYSKYGDDESKKKHRSDFVDTYRNIKEASERIAAKHNDPHKASRELGKVVATEIKRLRGQTSDDSIGRATATDKYNAMANDLVKYHKITAYGSLSKSSPYSKARKFEHSNGVSKGDLATSVMDVLEGGSLEPGKRRKSGEKKWKPADAYVGVAEREGGKDLSLDSANGATKYMVETMGIRGVQFGNSVTDDERKHHAAKCAEAMVDLADVLGVPVDAVSLDGKLGIAIGARGRGGAVAHYEPGTKVINLTRKKGVGSLAHEWGHGFDDQLVPGNGVKFGSTTFDEKSEVGKAMGDVRKAWNSSGFETRLSGLLHGRGSLGLNAQYWDSREEKFARTFERYVQVKLESSDRKNTYLAGVKTKGYKQGGLWPTDDEVKEMTPAFDKLFDTWRTENLGVKDRVKYSATERELITQAVLNATVEQYRTNAMPSIAKSPSSGSKPKRKSKKQSALTTGAHGDKGRYVTIDGHPVFITSGGQINRGPRHLKGKHESKVTGTRTQRTREKSSPQTAARQSKNSPVEKAVSTERIFVPRSKFDHRIAETIEGRGSGSKGAVAANDVAHFKELVDDAHKLVSGEAEEVNDSLRELLSNFGHTGRRVNGFQATVRRAADGAVIPGFDEMVDYAKNHMPHVLKMDDGESTGEGDHETALLNRIRQGFDKQIAKSSPEILKIASDMYDQSSGPVELDYDPNDFIGGRVSMDENDPFASYVPFAAYLASSVVEGTIEGAVSV